MRKMKKIMAFAVSAVLVASLAACGGNGGSTETQGTSKETEAGQTTGGDETPAEGNLKTGLAIVTNINKSKNAGDEAGVGQVDSTAIAVLVDADGKLVDIQIDAAQTLVNFDNSGKITSDKNMDVKSKVELGEDYGMKGNSGIGKEWFEQVDALEELVKGKTADEIVGLKLDDGKLVDATSSVTITASGYIAAIEKAMKNAEDLGAQGGDSIKLAIVSSVSGSKSVGEDERAPETGKVEVYSFYSAVSVNADKTVTSAIIDASQGTVKFDADGAITSDLAAEQPSKNELGDDYGMKGNSGIGKEWDEQAAFFADSIKGMNSAAISGIELDDGGYPTDADMLSGVTVHINEMVEVVSKALSN